MSSIGRMSKTYRCVKKADYQAPLPKILFWLCGTESWTSMILVSYKSEVYWYRTCPGNTDFWRS